MTIKSDIKGDIKHFKVFSMYLFNGNYLQRKYNV